MGNDEKTERMLSAYSKALATYNAAVDKYDKAIETVNSALPQITKTLSVAAETCRKTGTAAKAMRSASSRISYIKSKCLTLASFASRKLKSIHEQINTKKKVELVRLFLRDKLDKLHYLSVVLSPQHIKKCAVSFIRSLIPGFGISICHVISQSPLGIVATESVSSNNKFLRYFIYANAPNAVIAV